QGGAGTSPGGGTPGSKPASVTASPGAASPASGAGTSPGASTSSGGASGPTPTSGAKASPPTAPGAKPAPAASPGGLFGGFLGGGGGGNAMIANMVVGALRPHIPEYADVVLAELLKPENKRAIRNYLSGILADGAKQTFGNVDMKWYDSILRKHGCKDAEA